MIPTSIKTVMGLLVLATNTFARSLHSPNDHQPVAKLTNGTVLGIHSATYEQDFFLGVPFAQPPVNDLRFRNPQSLNTTFDPAGFQVTEYAPSCMGYGAG